MECYALVVEWTGDNCVGAKKNDKRGQRPHCSFWLVWTRWSGTIRSGLTWQAWIMKELWLKNCHFDAQKRAKRVPCTLYHVGSRCVCLFVCTPLLLFLGDYFGDSIDRYNISHHNAYNHSLARLGEKKKQKRWTILCFSFLGEKKTMSLAPVVANTSQPPESPQYSLEDQERSGVIRGWLWITSQWGSRAFKRPSFLSKTHNNERILSQYNWRWRVKVVFAVRVCVSSFLGRGLCLFALFGKGWWLVGLSVFLAKYIEDTISGGKSLWQRQFGLLHSSV